jgi:CheY-like chemotaxis protein
VPDDRALLGRDEPHLLIVEDDATFAEALGEVIHAQGLKYVVASDGESALRLAREMCPCGIVLDVQLPDVDGFAVMESLRNDANTASIPVHFVSALEAGERGIALGAVGYLTKPASRGDLMRVVGSLTPAGRERRVLIVEPDGDVADSLAGRLRGERIELRRAASAREALSVIDQEQLECVVVDLALPDMDGLDFLRAVRQQRPAGGPPVVVYTGRALSKLETQRLEAYSETVVLKEGSGVERLLDEIKLFARRLRQALPARRSPSVKPPSSVRLEGRTILLADDDMRTVYALSAVLRAKGAEVLVADTGRAALETLSAHPRVEAVLMDIMMPEMDGYEAIRQIRRQARFAALPIIALTAKAMKGDREKCLDVGASDYLSKPIDPEDLATMLHDRLSRSAPDGA